MSDADAERLAYLARLKARLIAQRDGYVAPVPVPSPPAPEPVQEVIPEPQPVVVPSPAARRIRRGDALAIALIARKLAANADVTDGQVLAVIARKMAKLTGAHQAYEIAGQILAEVRP